MHLFTKLMGCVARTELKTKLPTSTTGARHSCCESNIVANIRGRLNFQKKPSLAKKFSEIRLHSITRELNRHARKSANRFEENI